MPYDAELDVKKFSEEVEFVDSKIVISVMCYNEGIEKLQLSREIKNAEGEYRFSKLGRMIKEEVEKVLPIIEKAVKTME